MSVRVMPSIGFPSVSVTSWRSHTVFFGAAFNLPILVIAEGGAPAVVA